jgi:predicted lipid-binding transport protein (Tim44 family)
LNFILWAGSAWFVYKETRFFKSRNAQQQQQQQTQAPASNFSNIGSPPMQQPTQIRPQGTMG